MSQDKEKNSNILFIIIGTIVCLLLLTAIIFVSIRLKKLEPPSNYKYIDTKGNIDTYAIQKNQRYTADIFKNIE